MVCLLCMHTATVALINNKYIFRKSVISVFINNWIPKTITKSNIISQNKSNLSIKKMGLNEEFPPENNAVEFAAIKANSVNRNTAAPSFDEIGHQVKEPQIPTQNETFIMNFTSDDEPTAMVQSPSIIQNPSSRAITDNNIGACEKIIVTILVLIAIEVVIFVGYIGSRF